VGETRGGERRWPPSPREGDRAVPLGFKTKKRVHSKATERHCASASGGRRGRWETAGGGLALWSQSPTSRGPPALRKSLDRCRKRHRKRLASPSGHPRKFCDRTTLGKTGQFPIRGEREKRRGRALVAFPRFSERNSHWEGGYPPTVPPPRRMMGGW